MLSIVNVVGSSIARESDDVLYTWAGPEIAVATTKAYSTQMAVLHLLGLYFGDVLGTVDYETYSAMVRGLEALPGQMEQVLSHTEDIRAAAKWLAQEEDVFFIGRNLDYALVPGGEPETEGDQLHPLGGLCGGGTQARHHQPDRRGHAGHRPRHPGRGL